MNIWLRLHGFELCSWTIVWENLKNAFEADGDNVHYAAEPKNPEDFVEIWWGDPQYWAWSTKKTKLRVAIALSEAHSILNQGRQNVINNLNDADVIICPSSSATIAFKEAPIEKPIHVVFFGVSLTDFPYVDRDWTSATKYGYLHAGVTQFRKGSWLVPEAFIRAFGNNSNVQLTIATPKVTPMFVQLKLEYGRQPNIKFISEIVESSFELYKENHIYVSPHLSEGFGLMIPEAMSTGMACVVSKCSAPREFFDSKYGWWINMSELYAPVDQCLPDTAGYWRLPDVDHLADVMYYAYIMKTEAGKKGFDASNYVRNNLTWQHTVRGIKSIIKEYLYGKENIGDTASI